MCKSISVATLVLVLILCVGCQRTPNTTTASDGTPPAAPGVSTGQPTEVKDSSTTGKPKTDACALLTSGEVESVQREAIKATKLTGADEGGFSMSQCFFTLPTFTNSISLQVTQKGDGAGARDPRDFWSATFHRDSKPESEREKEKAKNKEGKEEEEGSATPPKKVSGVGEEAYWMGGRVGGALYVLKGNTYLRISVGGAENEENKIKKSVMLAQKALARLAP